MKNKTFFVQAIVWGVFLFCGIVADAQVKELPELTFFQENGKEEVLSRPIAKLLYFFGEKELLNQRAFDILNQVAYSFRTKELEVFAIYVDHESKAKIQDVQEIAKNCIYPFLFDPQGKEFQRLSMDKIPLLLISDEQGTITYSESPESWNYMQIRQQAKYALKFITVEESQQASAASDLFASKNWVAETEKAPKLLVVSENKPVVKDTTEKPENKIPATIKQDSEKMQEAKAVLSWKQDLADPIMTKVPVITSLNYKPLGSSHKEIGISNTPENHLFFFFIDFLVKVFPLVLWGWGMLYTLAKVLKYKGMLWSFLACLFFFSLNLLYTIMQIPFSLAILYYPLLVWQQTSLQHYEWLKSFSTVSMETILLIVCQFALLAGLSSRYKKEKECLA